MDEQPQRRPGRPRKTKGGAERVFWTISREVVEALEQVTDNQNNFVDQWLRQNPEIAAQLMATQGRSIPKTETGNLQCLDIVVW